MSKLHHYWKELQRRHVVKAGIAYLVAAWLIIQVLSIFIPAFDASSDNLRTAIIVLGIGFPIWLVINRKSSIGCKIPPDVGLFIIKRYIIPFCSYWLKHKFIEINNKKGWIWF